MDHQIISQVGRGKDRNGTWPYLCLEIFFFFFLRDKAHNNNILPIAEKEKCL